MNAKNPLARLALISTISAVLLFVGIVVFPNRFLDAVPQEQFVGGVRENLADAARKPVAVRNDVAQPGEDIVTLRYFKIHKGQFPAFYKASVEGVWPFFEKIGARVVGQWEVIHPDTGAGTGRAGEDSAEYDEVYLMTRYASVAHWRATRDMSTHGGNGPDWAKCREALTFRRSITYDTHLTFLKGHLATNGPYFMPGLPE